MTTVSERHPVYPGGPDCQPNCPGPWSMYHDGYADGYENAEAARPVAQLRAAVEALPRFTVVGSGPLVQTEYGRWVMREWVLRLLSDEGAS